jgi:sugar phosphate isomerase/epimerase
VGVRTGLVSVTFRQLAVDEIVKVAKDAGLAAIEWGGDIHVPLGDLAAYGSYLRAGSVDREEIRTAVNTAAELGAPRIRVWAGTVGTAEAGVGDRMAVTRGLAELADVAAGAGIEIAMEFHRGTLTDEVDSTITLLLDVGAPNPRRTGNPRST